MLYRIPLVLLLAMLRYPTSTKRGASVRGFNGILFSLECQFLRLNM